MGPNEAKILTDCYRTRRQLPKAIQEAPELLLGLEFTYSAYWELNTCREYGFSAGPIPWTAIKDFAEAHELDPDEFREFEYLIREMDRANLKWNEAHKNDAAPPPAK